VVGVSITTVELRLNCALQLLTVAGDTPAN
jgi:hypothetical protein